jgi:hypothetical protein
MPVDGMPKKMKCPDCSKRVTAIYNGSRWVIQKHADKAGAWCSRGAS